MAELARRTVLASAMAVGATAAGAPAATAEEYTRDFPACEWTEAELEDRKRVLNAGFTEDEADCWLLVARAAGKFLDLPFMHPSIIPEAVVAWHEIQEKLLMRPTYRKYRAGVGGSEVSAAEQSYPQPSA